jgi:hypothetical protein
MNVTPQRIQVFAIIPFWISVALIGFVAYHNPPHMKYVLAMNLLALAYTMIVFGSWLKAKLGE